jgi:hydroxymethylpyrimidine/phosphomethylpyrimidine kinase
MITALSVAGSDSGGGAGIQADLKTFAAHGVFGMTAITAVTAQNTLGVDRVDVLPVEAFAAQLQSVFDDFPVTVIKVGMLATAEHAAELANRLTAMPRRPPIVLDPVMVASTGHRLLDDDAVAIIRDRLLPLCTVATPNLAEAAVLAGDQRLDAWLAKAPAPILVTGGDPPAGAPEVGGEIVDALWMNGGLQRKWTGRRIGRRPYHGTGCTLASAIAARLARGEKLPEAIEKAIAWVRALVAIGERLGSGNPVLPHHAVPPA